MGKNVDFSELEAFADRLRNAGKWAEVRKGIVDDLANRLITLAKNDTPVGVYPNGKKGGTLRRGFSTKNFRITETADYYEVEIINPVEYASYVEYGHRTRGGKGWVEGRFMLSKAEIKLANNAERFVRKKLEQFLKELIDGD